MTCALIVNQDPQQRSAIADALAGEGISSLGARSDEHAVVLLHDAAPNLMIWDWPAGEMPPEIFLSLVRREGFNGPLVVCASSLDLDGVPYDALVRKPFELGQLVTTVGRLLPPACGGSGPRAPGHGSGA